MPDGLLHMERTLFGRTFGAGATHTARRGTSQVGDVVRMTFSGGIGTLENEIKPQAETGQLRALEGG